MEQPTSIISDDLTPGDPDAQMAEAAEKEIEAEKERMLSDVGDSSDAPPVAEVPGPEVGEEKTYNVYHCARPSMHMHTPTGRDIRFNDKRHITDNAEVIEYLDSEIAAGNRFITVNAEQPTVTSSDLDPMAAIKRNIIKEYLAEEAAKVKTPRDMGSTDNKAGIQPGSIKVRIPSTADLGELAGDSNSGKA